MPPDSSSKEVVPNCFWAGARKWLRRVFVSFCVLLPLTFILENAFPAGLATTATKQASALLFPQSQFTELPETVEISIDGVRAIFHRGDKTYDHLVNLLHNGRSDEMTSAAAAGAPFAFTGPQCGELVIRCYGITSRFIIERNVGNKNLYWIWLPHLNRGGYAIPVFTADPRVIDLIKTSGTTTSTMP